MYDRIGVDYALGRRPDHRWQGAVDAALGTSRSVLNVGAGTGSYEPSDRYVVAVELSRTMIAQRPAGGTPVLQAAAENLPLADARFDVAMALVTLHHWRDWAAGLREMQRVANRVVILHFDPESFHSGFWLVRDYLPEIAELALKIPSVQQVAAALGEDVEVRTLPVPWDCVDGFLAAFWRRPQAYQDPDVRRSMSGLQLLDPQVLARGMTQLRIDLDDGTWHRRNKRTCSSWMPWTWGGGSYPPERHSLAIRTRADISPQDDPHAGATCTIEILSCTIQVWPP